MGSICQWCGEFVEGEFDPANCPQAPGLCER